LILPPERSTLDGTIGQQRLAFAMESPKLCEELTGMGRRPSAWMTELIEGVAGCMEAHSPIGGLGWRYHEDEELLELVVYTYCISC
jgi:hypothetical protein